MLVLWLYNRFLHTIAGIFFTRKYFVLILRTHMTHTYVYISLPVNNNKFRSAVLSSKNNKNRAITTEHARNTFNAAIRIIRFVVVSSIFCDFDRRHLDRPPPNVSYLMRDEGERKIKRVNELLFTIFIFFITLQPIRSHAAVTTHVQTCLFPNKICLW